MSVLGDLSEIVSNAYREEGLEPSFGEVVVSQRPDLAQFQNNGALQIAKTAGRAPRDIAKAIADRLRRRSELSEVDVAGPGFVNFSVTDRYLADRLQVVANDERLGVPAVQHPHHVVLDYGGPNVAKAMHVGHLRPSIIGNSLDRIFQFAGHRATSDIHLGDWGMPMGMLIKEVELEQPDLPYFDAGLDGPYPADSPVTVEDLQRMYPAASARVAEDHEAAEGARQATQEVQQGRTGYRALWQHFVDVTRATNESDFADLGIYFDLWYGESTVHDRIRSMLDRIDPVSETSEGALVIDVARPDDKQEIPPLLLVKQDGGYLYGTTDLATVEMRIDDLDASEILYIVDAGQSLHFEQVFRGARMSGIAPDRVRLEHIPFGTVNGTDGKRLKTREGNVPRLAELNEAVRSAALQRLKEGDIAADYPSSEREAIAHAVGNAALKYGDLSNHRSSHYVFDVDRFTSFEGKTGPYLLYAVVRIKSLQEKARDGGLIAGPLAPPTVDQERSLMLRLAELPEVFARSLEGRAPNHLAEYAYDVASQFSRFYEVCHILSEENVVRQASWLTLVDLTRRILELLLDLLGIDVPDRM